MIFVTLMHSMLKYMIKNLLFVFMQLQLDEDLAREMKIDFIVDFYLKSLIDKGINVGFFLNH